MRSNAPGARVCRLVWGSDDPLETLGLPREPDVVLASDVVYGNDPEKWGLLVKTMRDLCGAHTLLIVGNVQRYPVHHPLAESRFFHESTAADFVRREVPIQSLHPEYRGTGAGSCAVHLFRRRAETTSMTRGGGKRDLALDIDGPTPGGGGKQAKERKKEKRQKTVGV